jgi:hypothetical protein
LKHGLPYPDGDEIVDLLGKTFIVVPLVYKFFNTVQLIWLMILSVPPAQVPAKLKEAETLPKILMTDIDVNWLQTISEGIFTLVTVTTDVAAYDLKRYYLIFIDGCLCREGWAAPLRGFMREGTLLQTIHFNSILVDPFNLTGILQRDTKLFAVLPGAVGLFFNNLKVRKDYINRRLISWISRLFRQKEYPCQSLLFFLSQSIPKKILKVMLIEKRPLCLINTAILWRFLGE